MLRYRGLWYGIVWYGMLLFGTVWCGLFDIECYMLFGIVGICNVYGNVWYMYCAIVLWGMV